MVPSGRPKWSEVCLGAPVSTLLTASSAVILPAPILKPKWVQYQKQHGKVDVRPTAVHLTGVCILRAITGACLSLGVCLTGVHLVTVHPIRCVFRRAYISKTRIS
jgi:hypothetical protein